MEFLLKKGDLRTEIKYFVEGQNKLKILPFFSNVINLQMVLKNANGIKDIVPVDESIFNKEISIIEFGYLFFKYDSIDNDFTIKLDIS